MVCLFYNQNRLIVLKCTRRKIKKWVFSNSIKEKPEFCHIMKEINNYQKYQNKNWIRRMRTVLPQFFNRNFPLFNRRIILQILRLNELIVNFATEIFNRNFLNRNSGARLLGNLKECTYLDSPLTNCQNFYENLLTE